MKPASTTKQGSSKLMSKGPQVSLGRESGRRANRFYDRARFSLTRAIECDEAKRVQEAIAHYIDACEQVVLGLKQDKDDSSRSLMLKRVRDWLERAEALKVSLKLSSLPIATEDSTKLRKQTGWKDPFRGVVGLESVKQALREAVLLPALQPQLFTGERKPWRGILLFGPPGTGKSLLASAVAEEAECEFFALSSSDIVSKYLGDSERRVRELFERARKAVKDKSGRRAVIFIDEIDAIGRSRDAGSGDSESGRRLLTELLKQMDGVGQDNSNIVVMGATNLPQSLDPALRRRFERRLYVPLPGVKARAKMLAKLLGPPGIDHELNPAQIGSLATRTKGFSGADIASLANEILLRPVRTCLSARYFARTVDGSLVPCASSARWAEPMRMLDKNFDAKALVVPLATMVDAEYALTRSKPSCNPKELDKLNAFASEFGETIDVHNEEDERVSGSRLEIAKSVEEVWKEDPRYKNKSAESAKGMLGWTAAALASLNEGMNKMMVPS